MIPATPAWAEVDLSALKRNYRTLAAFSRGGRVWPVVKADAYGHGLLPAARALLSAGADRLAVAFPSEGAALRRGGVRVPVLVLAPTLPAEVPLLVEERLTPQISSLEGARAVSREACRRRRRVFVHVKIDSGMGRVGFLPQELRRDLPALLTLPGLRVEAFYTHLATAEWENPAFARRQAGRFRTLLKDLAVRFWPEDLPFPEAHLSNSAALLTGVVGWKSLGARPGLSLYGAYPSPRLRRQAVLEPVMSLKARVVHVKSLGRGDSVSYGRTFVARRRMRVATLGAGYADGVLRSLSNRGRCLVRGRSAPFVGTVCMDMTMVDVTRVPGVRPGDAAVLFGRGEEGVLPVEEQAAAAGTIPYELLCAVGPRVPRVYRGGGA